MEIFIEEMVQKEKTPKDFLLIGSIVGLAALLTFVILMIIMPTFPAFGTLIFLLAAAVVYGAYILVKSFNLEYEYSLVNTELDIDKIVNRTRRKRIVTNAPIRNLEAFGTKSNPDFANYANNPVVSKVYACRNKAAEDVFFMVYNKGDKKIMLVFNPSERIIEQIVKRNPQKQFI